MDLQKTVWGKISTTTLCCFWLASSGWAAETDRVFSLIEQKQIEVSEVETKLAESPSSDTQTLRLQEKLHRLQGELKLLQLKRSNPKKYK